MHPYLDWSVAGHRDTEASFPTCRVKKSKESWRLVAKEVSFRLRSVSGLQILGFRSLAMMDRRWEIRIPITDEIKLDDLM